MKRAAAPDSLAETLGMGGTMDHVIASVGLTVAADRSEYALGDGGGQFDCLACSGDCGNAVAIESSRSTGAGAMV